MHWYPHHEGSIRGKLQGREAAAAASTTPAPAADSPPENKCYSMFSQMSMNELQRYPSNPDSAATGYVDVKLCTNGTLQATALMFGGVSRLIAMHIHKCEGGATPQTNSAELCHGPPVVNFCGDNSAGMIADGAKYTVPCAPWAHGASRAADMPGVVISEISEGASAAGVAAQVEDIARNPQLYYFN